MLALLLGTALSLKLIHQDCPISGPITTDSTVSGCTYAGSATFPTVTGGAYLVIDNCQFLNLQGSGYGFVIKVANSGSVYLFGSNIADVTASSSSGRAVQLKADKLIVVEGDRFLRINGAGGALYIPQCGAQVHVRLCEFEDVHSAGDNGIVTTMALESYFRHLTFKNSDGRSGVWFDVELDDRTPEFIGFYMLNCEWVTDTLRLKKLTGVIEGSHFINSTVRYETQGIMYYENTVFESGGNPLLIGVDHSNAGSGFFSGVTFTGLDTAIRAIGGNQGGKSIEICNSVVQDCRVGISPSVDIVSVIGTQFLNLRSYAIVYTGLLKHLYVDGCYFAPACGGDGPFDPRQ
jgi:hypothetical protein